MSFWKKIDKLSSLQRLGFPPNSFPPVYPKLVKNMSKKLFSVHGTASSTVINVGLGYNGFILTLQLSLYLYKLRNWYKI